MGSEANMNKRFLLLEASTHAEKLDCGVEYSVDYLLFSAEPADVETLCGPKIPGEFKNDRCD